MHEVQVKAIVSARGGMNLYRGCTHGCIYCDSRSKCYQMAHAFEDVAVKINAPTLRQQALRHRKKRCMIATGSMCDPYLPLEKELGLTRNGLEMIAQSGFGATVLTKSTLVLRDLDLFQRIQAQSKCVVQMTLTTHDEALFPGMKQRYIHAFGGSYVCNSPDHEHLMRLFHALCQQYGMLHDNRRIFAYLAEFEDKLAGEQLCLF